MEAIAVGELFVIALLGFLNYRQGNESRRALLDLAAAADVREAELLNAARHPSYVLPTGGPTVPPRPKEELEAERKQREAWAKVGTVAEPTRGES